MLALLKIRNLALVDDLVWEPTPGFLSVTGETGAGKSVIIGGISLVLGERADKSIIRSGADSCCLEALFTLPDPTEINRRLEEVGVPPCEQGELIIRRVITASSNRQFINNTPVTLNLLRRVSSGLVDMHHPDSPRSLTSRERQLALLDAFAGAASVVSAYEADYRVWLQARHEREQLEQSEAANERELDFLRHQIHEIEQADFSQEEVAALEERWQRARNSSRLREAAVPVHLLLDENEQAALPRLRQAVRRARELERLDPTCAAWLKPMEEAVENLDDVCRAAEAYIEELDSDPATFSQLESRISLLDTLRRKYGADFAAISAHLELCREKLNALENREEHLAELQKAEQAAYAKLLQTAKELSSLRTRALPVLEKSFLQHAAHLGFRRSLFRVHVEPLSEPGPRGGEEVEFLFGPNPGEPLKPLRQIASGGELARVMLALKSALAKQDDTPLLLFDEIDANVGGEIARAVGMKMLELGKDHQVIAITHFPQVASLAAHHFLITKELADGRSVSRITEVEGRARIAEIVRMLGSSGSTAEAHARELLQLTHRTSKKA